MDTPSSYQGLILMKYIIQNYQDNVYKYYVVSNHHNFLKHCSMRIFI